MSAIPGLLAEERAARNILNELTVEQIDACDNPQIVQRVRGAKYILDLDGELTPQGVVERIRRQLNEWWDTDEPFLVLRHRVRLSVIVLPEVPE